MLGPVPNRVFRYGFKYSHAIYTLASIDSSIFSHVIRDPELEFGGEIHKGLVFSSNFFFTGPVDPVTTGALYSFFSSKS